MTKEEQQGESTVKEEHEEPTEHAPMNYSPPKLRRFNTSASAPTTSVSNLRRDEVVGEDECTVCMDNNCSHILLSR